MRSIKLRWPSHVIVIIHGHFYQPPRESPWTGLIAPEASAAPFPNWNERILSECYIANAHAHMMEGTVVHVRNNYESLNFDFGPTLAAWMERHGKPAYRAMRRGDELSAAAHGGHGNAIAQSYNHSILPLLDAARSRVADLRGASRISSIASVIGPTASGCPNAPSMMRRCNRLPRQV